MSGKRLVALIHQVHFADGPQRRRQQNRMAQQAYRVRQRFTLGSLRTECDLLRKENVELKERLKHQHNALSLDCRTFPVDQNESGNGWWSMREEEQSAKVPVLRPDPPAEVLSGGRVL